MSQESADRLVNFIHKAFGAQCAAILLVGLGEEPVQATKRLDVRDTEEGKEWEVEVEVVGGVLPCRTEPLVLAVLLKMLLGRERLPSPLEFHMSDVVDELQQIGVSLTDDGIDRIISKYAALSYDKRAKGGDESEEAGGGVYSLITGYFRGSEKEAGGTSRARVSGSVHFEQRFVAGLREGEIILVGIRFGRLGEPAR
jgi:hypothetical protein